MVGMIKTVIMRGALIILIIAGGYYQSRPCGYDNPPSSGYSLLHPTLLENAPIMPPFIFNFRDYYLYDKTRQDDQVLIEDRNIKEWKVYFGNVPMTVDIKEVIYKYAGYDLQKIQTQKDNPNGQLPARLMNNTLVQQLITSDFPDFLPYLLFAKSCEPFATWRDPWQHNPVDSSRVKELYERGVELYKNTTSDFIRLRCGYQLVRLAHYFQLNPLTAYDQFVQPLDSREDLLKYWALEQKAGYLTKSEQFAERVEGNYLLTKVLEYCPERSHKIYRSFSITDETEWNACLQRCETAAERARLHYLRGLEMRSIALEEIETMYQLAPQIPEIEILMLREMQKLESRFLGKDFNQMEYFDEIHADIIPTYLAEEYLSAVQQFVRQVVREQKVERMYFWQVMNGYLEYLTGNHSAADQLLEMAKNALPQHTKWEEQIEILQFAVRLNTIDQITDREEKIIGDELMQNSLWEDYFDPEAKRWRYEYNNHDFITEKLAYLYWNKGEFGKAHLCRYSIHQLKYCNDATIARAILDFFDKSDKNKFEQFLLEKELIKDREMILEILGTALLAEHKIVAAQEVLTKVCNSPIDIVDPFSGYLHLQKTMRKKTIWTKYEIAETLEQLENYLQNNTNNIATTHLKLAHYHYNVSYYGHAWQAIDFYKSYSSIFGEKEKYRDGFYKKPMFRFGRGNYDFLDLTRAKYHYLQVITNTKDRALQAQAYYGLEACDRAEMEKKAEIDRRKDPELLRYYFAELACYDDTDFYKDIVVECADFSWFVN